MFKIIISDLSRVILFPKDRSYYGSLNSFYSEHCKEPNFNFWNYYEINQEYLDFLKTLKLKLKLILFTSGSIQNTKELQFKLLEIFEELLNPAIVGFNKDKKEAYTSVAKRYNVNTNEMILIDDDKSFVEAARQASVKIIRYSGDNRILFLVLNQIIN